MRVLTLRWQLIAAAAMFSAALLISPKLRTLLWSQEAAGWAQALFSVVAITAAVWLSERERRIQHKQAVYQRRKAASAIAAACLGTMRELDKRARAQSFTRDLMPFYIDETAADLAAVASINLIDCVEEGLVLDLVALRRSAQTAARRARIVQRRVRKGEEYPEDYFASLLTQTQDTVRRLGA